MKISVIIPTYNQGQFIEETLQSLFAQDYLDREVILVDGGSTDSTLEIVERYSDEIDLIISEPDAGQSDAIRKGAELATGDMLTWLNSDDILLPGALSDVAKTVEKFPECEFVLGNVVWIDVDGEIQRCRKGETSNRFLLRCGMLTASGPSAFFSKRLYHSVGGIDVHLQYMMDTELWWRFVVSGATYRRLSNYTWALRLHEDAKMSGHLFVDGKDTHAPQKNDERAQVEELICAFCPFPLPNAARKFGSVCRVLTSLNYWRSLLDSRKYLHKHISELGKAQKR